MSARELISRYDTPVRTTLRGVLVVALLLGLALASDTACAKIVNPNVERVDAAHLIVTWSSDVPVTVYWEPRADSDREHGSLLASENHDGRLWVTLKGNQLTQRPYFLLGDRGDRPVRVAERVLPLERGSNTRDVGGYATADGRHVKWGLIYRSGATPVVTDRDVAYLRSLGWVDMIDLRSAQERRLAPTRLGGDGVRLLTSDYSYATLPDNYLGLLEVLKPQLRLLFQELRLRHVPLSYNCTAGQDRTGIATALVLSALGVPRDQILADYHLSTIHRHPENEAPPMTPAQVRDDPLAAVLAGVRQSRPDPLYSPQGRSYLAELFDGIDARWGSVDGYLAEVLGVGSPQLAELRANYLE